MVRMKYLYRNFRFKGGYRNDVKYKDRDNISRTLVGYMKDFFSSVRLDKFKVVFIPVKYPKTDELISYPEPNIIEKIDSNKESIKK